MPTITPLSGPNWPELDSPTLQIEGERAPVIKEPVSCLKSRCWYLMPGLVLCAASIAWIAEGLYDGRGMKSMKEWRNYAGLATAGAVGVSLLSVMGRSVFVRVKNGSAAATSDMKRSVRAFLEPEGGIANTCCALLPLICCLAVFCKKLEQDEEVVLEPLPDARYAAWEG